MKGKEKVAYCSKFVQNLEVAMYNAGYKNKPGKMYYGYAKWKREDDAYKVICIINNHGRAMVATKVNLELVREKTLEKLVFPNPDLPVKWLFVLQHEGTADRAVVPKENIIQVSEHGELSGKITDDFSEVRHLMKETEKIDRIWMNVIKKQNRQHYPFLTLAIILACVYVYKNGMSRGFELIPANVNAGLQLENIIMYMFGHANIMHLIGNVIAFWIFGAELERLIGTRKYLLFCTAAALYTGCGYSMFALGNYSAKYVSTMPTLGLSGLVFATVGAVMAYNVKYGNPVKDLLLFVVYQFAMTLFRANVNNVIHLIGLVAGFVISYLIYTSIELYYDVQYADVKFASMELEKKVNNGEILKKQVN